MTKEIGGDPAQGLQNRKGNLLLRCHFDAGYQRRTSIQFYRAACFLAELEKSSNLTALSVFR